MAEDKKGFILYADLIHVVDELTDKEAGLLFKHILAYVNDLHPISDNRIVNLSFGPIKQQLKRDLAKFEEIKQKRAELGKLGGLKSGEARRNKMNQLLQETKLNEPIASIGKANEAVNVNDNDTVTDNVINITNVIYLREGEENLRFGLGKQIYAGTPSDLAKTKEHKNYLDNWLVGKQISIEQFSKAFDEEFLGKTFTNHQHFQNAISKTVKNLIEQKHGTVKTNIRTNPTSRFNVGEPNNHKSGAAKWD